MTDPLQLVGDRVQALTMPVGLDRPRSMFPERPDMFGSINCYLLSEGDRALLVDTGFPSFRDDVLGLLAGQLGEADVLSVVVQRPAEISSIGNLFSVMEEHDVTTLQTCIGPEILHAFDVRPLADRNPSGSRGHGYRQLTGGEAITLAGDRKLEIIRPMLQLLNQIWIYDADTQTMFTSEYFGYGLSSTAAGPWAVTESDTTAEEIAEILRTGNRTWWLAGADGRRLADWLGDMFETHHVERIAPSFGTIFVGAELVARQVTLMQEALMLLASNHEVSSV